MEIDMSYRVNASSSAGAVSITAFSLEEAFEKADELKAKNFANVVIIDAGTGLPVKSGEVRDA